ncbi:MAG: DNA internalization-related competence protein ComEC/Rec2, partial [Methylococcales bacterium]
GAVKMTLLDVGQGLAAVVQTATHFLVFDTGAKFSNDSDMGRSVLLPFLWAQGLQSLDALIVSHGDNDHIGGAQSLLAELPATQLLTSVPQQLAGYAPTPCRAGQSWQWDQVTFSILSPDQELSSDNDNSCVLKIQSAYGSALLPADIEVDAEARLVQRYGSALSAAILVAPHHGSKTSSSWSFLQTVKPDYVLIPAGYQNQFGHPHPEVLQRYRQLNSQWLSSAEHGAIEVKLEPGHIDVQCLRASAARYWNNRPQ